MYIIYESKHFFYNNIYHFIMVPLILYYTLLKYNSGNKNNRLQRFSDSITNNFLKCLYHYIYNMKKILLSSLIIFIMKFLSAGSVKFYLLSSLTRMIMLSHILFPHTRIIIKTNRELRLQIVI